MSVVHVAEEVKAGSDQVALPYAIWEPVHGVLGRPSRTPNSTDELGATMRIDPCREGAAEGDDRSRVQGERK
jgi:hypothetical protein